MTPLLPCSPTAMDDAATGLLAVACTDPTITTAELRLHCLWAVERLRGVGARPTRDLHRTVDVMATIWSALTALDAWRGERADRAVVDEVARTVRDALREPG